MENVRNLLKKMALSGDGINTYHQGVVVPANPSTVLNDRRAKKEIRNQIIRADGLIAYMKNANEDPTVCPRCGGKLVVRHGKYGTFMGCSNYPKCRYTREIPS